MSGRFLPGGYKDVARRELNPSEYVVWEAVDCWKPKEGRYGQTVANMARYLGMNRRTVERSVKGCVEKGFMEYEAGGSGRHSRSVFIALRTVAIPTEVQRIADGNATKVHGNTDKNTQPSSKEPKAKNQLLRFAPEDSGKLPDNGKLPPQAKFFPEAVTLVESFPEVLAAFVEARRRMKVPDTDLAWKRIASRFVNGYRDPKTGDQMEFAGPEDYVECMAVSVENGWKSVFSVSGKRKESGNGEEQEYRFFD